MYKTLPRYGKKADEYLRPGLYLGLYHGFVNDDERQATDDWGSVGPVIGPLVYCHTTYSVHLQLEFVDASAALPYQPYMVIRNGTQGELNIGGSAQDCLLFDGMEYGDWTAFVVTP